MKFYILHRQWQAREGVAAGKWYDQINHAVSSRDNTRLEQLGNMHLKLSCEAEQARGKLQCYLPLSFLKKKF